MKKTPGPNDFSDEFYQTFKEKIILIPHKYSQQIEEDRMLSTVFYEMRITPKPKPGKHTHTHKKQTPRAIRNIHVEILNKNV